MEGLSQFDMVTLSTIMINGKLLKNHTEQEIQDWGVAFGLSQDNIDMYKIAINMLNTII